LNADKCCAVRAGDTLGLVNADAVVSQFVVDGLSARLSTSDGDSVDAGNQLTFDSLVLPYRFSLAAAYDTGLRYHYQNSHTLLCATPIIIGLPTGRHIMMIMLNAVEFFSLSFRFYRNTVLAAVERPPIKCILKVRS